MKRRMSGVLALLTALLIIATPAAAAPPSACGLSLQVDPVHTSGERVVLHVSGLTGVGGIDIFISRRNRTDEFHLFLVPGITEFDFVYPLVLPGEEPLTLDAGRYRIHATDIVCEVRTGFRVAG
jgi:hypothetical protein